MAGNLKLEAFRLGLFLLSGWRLQSKWRAMADEDFSQKLSPVLEAVSTVCMTHPNCCKAAHLPQHQDKDSQHGLVRKDFSLLLIATSGRLI